MPAQDTSFNFVPPPLHAHLDSHFVAPEILRRSDIFARRARLLRLVSAQIIPRLADLHRGVTGADVEPAGEAEVHRLADLVLCDELEPAIAFITALRERGLSIETLFVDLLEPTARYLGQLWDDDACDFIDVTLGVGRLQHLLAIFNATHDLPAMNEKRQVLMTTLPGEEHGFGAAMVERFLRAGRWTVLSEPAAAIGQTAATVERQWFAVVGFTVSCDRSLDALAETIRSVRLRSCNPAIGIMVGGPVFSADPALAVRLGADATATNAPAAVVLAQKLFDRGAKTGWSL